MTDGNLDDLDDRLYPIAQKFLIECAAQALKVKILTTWRSPADQNEEYDKGLSKACAGESPHNCMGDDGEPAACAFDFGCFDEQGNYIKDGTHPFYTKAAQIGKSLGLVWGGDWKHKDYDHLELKDWRN